MQRTIDDIIDEAKEYGFCHTRKYRYYYNDKGVRYKNGECYQVKEVRRILGKRANRRCPASGKLAYEELVPFDEKNMPWLNPVS